MGRSSPVFIPSLVRLLLRFGLCWHFGWGFSDCWREVLSMLSDLAGLSCSFRSFGPDWSSFGAGVTTWASPGLVPATPSQNILTPFALFCSVCSVLGLSSLF